MDWVYIDGLIAGASLTIKMGATTMVSAAIVTQTPQWFQLAAHPIPVGSVLKARQSIGSAHSAVTPSSPIEVAPALATPVIAPAPLDCQTSMHLSHMQPGADLKITNGAQEWDVLFPKHTNSADGERPAGDRCSADRRVHAGPGRAGVLRERSALVRRGNNCLFRLLPSYGDEFRARMRRVYLLHS